MSDGMSDGPPYGWVKDSAPEPLGTDEEIGTLQARVAELEQNNKAWKEACFVTASLAAEARIDACAALDEVARLRGLLKEIASHKTNEYRKHTIGEWSYVDTTGLGSGSELPQEKRVTRDVEHWVYVLSDDLANRIKLETK